MSDIILPSQPSVEWRGRFENDEVNRLHAECFEHQLIADDWWSRVNRYSLGWVCMRCGEHLIGFVNVAWDGGAHAFLLDTMIATAARRLGHAARLVAEAIHQAGESPCEWLHVDFEPHLRGFYLDACAFKATDAGLISLTKR